MSENELKDGIEKLVLACNGNIPLLIAELEKVKLKFPDKIIVIEALESGLKRAIGKVS